VIYKSSKAGKKVWSKKIMEKDTKVRYVGTRKKSKNCTQKRLLSLIDFMQELIFTNRAKTTNFIV